jgi:predicted dehydrogenase
MNDALGVAVVGIGASQWSGIAHLPALASTPGLEVVRLVTSSAESAKRAQETWDVPASGTLEEALEDDAVDVVTITVRVAHHAGIAAAAIRAGKHVYCEWPLAVDSAEADSLAQLSAQHPDRLHVVGLQGRLAPELRAVASAVADGRIDRPLRATVQVFLPQGLQARPLHRAHLRHRSAAANVLSIQGGHSLDMLVSVLGEAGPVQAAEIWTAVDEFTVLETGERLPRDAPDNVMAHLALGGVPVTLQLSQTSARSSTTIDILGTVGSIRITAPDQPQMSPLDVTVTDLGMAPGLLSISEAQPSIGLDRTHPGYNVAQTYRLMSDVAWGRADRSSLPTFDRAVSVHRLIEEIERTAARQSL